MDLITDGLLADAEHAADSQGMLQHTLLKDAAKLDGMYAQALNRIYNQVPAPVVHFTPSAVDPSTIRSAACCCHTACNACMCCQLQQSLYGDLCCLGASDLCCAV